MAKIDLSVVYRKRFFARSHAQQAQAVLDNDNSVNRISRFHLSYEAAVLELTLSCKALLFQLARFNDLADEETLKRRILSTPTLAESVRELKGLADELEKSVPHLNQLTEQLYDSASWISQLSSLSHEAMDLNPPEKLQEHRQRAERNGVIVTSGKEEESPATPEEQLANLINIDQAFAEFGETVSELADEW